jgi:hypothetical protein
VSVFTLFQESHNGLLILLPGQVECCLSTPIPTLQIICTDTMKDGEERVWERRGEGGKEGEGGRGGERGGMGKVGGEGLVTVAWAWMSAPPSSRTVTVSVLPQ